MLDLQTAAFIQQVEASGAPDFADLPPADCRVAFSGMVEMTGFPVAEVPFEDRQFVSGDSQIAVRVYRPAGQGPLPGIVYYHGGGFVIGSIADFHGVCSQLAARSGCCVIVPEYRLAPEFAFPTAHEDGYACLTWVADNAVELGVDASRLAVAGDSAGAHIATVAALLSRERSGPAIAYQALIYPGVSGVVGGTESYERCKEGYLLTGRSMDYFLGHYTSAESVQDDLRWAPLNADLSGLPPALVQTAQFDPLRDEGMAYADKLLAAGVQCVCSEYHGTIHGYLALGGALEVAGVALDQMVSALKKGLGC